jgi:CRISPR-associated protein Cmr4
MFHFFAQYAAPVTAHIAIDSATKTVRPGALWYEETLPPETLLYVPLMAEKSRKKGDEKEAVEICKAVVEDLFKDGAREDLWLQVGGNETVGMGWCAIKFIESEE